MLPNNRYINQAYCWDYPYKDVLIGKDFLDSINMDDLIIEEVNIYVNEIADEDTTEEEMNLVKKVDVNSSIQQEQEKTRSEGHW